MTKEEEEVIKELEENPSAMKCFAEALGMVIEEALKQRNETTEVKHGKWENVNIDYKVRYNMATMRCSICNRWNSKVYHYGNPVENVNYCPYCGAKMDTNENYVSEE